MVSKNESLWLTSGQTGENLARTQDLPVTFTRVEIGDANGTTPSLDPALTQLINKRQDGELISHELDPYDSSQRIITMAIPPTENFNAIEVLLYAKSGETEFAHTYFTLAAPFAVRTLENGGSQALVKYTIKVSQETDFTITAVPDLTYVTHKEQTLALNNIKAMTKAEFFALAEQRQAQSAGSGFSEWGKWLDNSHWDKVNEGMWLGSVEVPTQYMHLGTGISVKQGNSRHDAPYIIISGVKLKLQFIGVDHPDWMNNISFPPAPDGLDKKDNSGRFNDLTTAITAGGQSLETSVLSRQDFVFLEVWHEKISKEDIVYPLGNVQYAGKNYQNISLGNTFVGQSYSALGTWDNNTTGYGTRWSELNKQDRELFLQNPENNIYTDNDELIQVRYRVRVVAGQGQDWKMTSQLGNNSIENNLRVKPQGQQTIRPASDLNSYDGDKYGWFVDKDNTEFDNYVTAQSGDNGLFYAVNANTSNGLSYEKEGQYYGYNGLCYALPIALVQRRNQGAYHPSYNPQGTSTCVTSVNDTVFGNPWYENNVIKPNSASECFLVQNYGDPNPVAGAYYDTGSLLSESTYKGKGRPDGKFHDAIYADDIKDLRMSSRNFDKTEIRERYKRKAIAGEIRGFEGVPFTSPLSLYFTGTLKVNGPAFYNGITNSHPRIQVAIESTTIEEAGIEPAMNGRYTVLYGDNGNVMSVYGFNHISFGDGNTYIWTDFKDGPARHEEFNHLFPPGTVISALILTEKSQHSSVQPMWSDIIGRPDKIAATFPDGVEGQWVPIIPDGSHKIYPLNRKFTGYLQREVTNNNGLNWVIGTLDILDENHNTYNYNLGADQIVLLHYHTPSHFTEHTNSSKVIALGDVWAGAHNISTYGTGLISSLINKVPVSTDSLNIPVTRYGLDRERKLDPGTWGGGACQHIPIILNATGPAVKVLDYLTESKGKLRLNYAYKELIHDGNSWGDDGQFQVTNNQMTMADENSQNITYGMAGFDLPYFNTEIA
ncbi:hypothetical protein [Thalassomonas sp. RHCl1]|uniref:hypothetical protein n=1 Tax=Thalassomonas sp. RHCl1 TaxID=2995320 RepID=UPI00248CD898|nr:hypothetical protein [Thalassomonas sp. RHCl1]